MFRALCFLRYVLQILHNVKIDREVLQFSLILGARELRPRAFCALQIVKLDMMSFLSLALPLRCHGPLSGLCCPHHRTCSTSPVVDY